MQINVNVVPSWEKLADKFKGFEDILFKKVSEGISAYAFLIERGGKMFSPVDTGRMRGSVAVSMGIQDKGLSASIGPHVDYATYVHEGTRYMKGRPFMEWGLNAYKTEGNRVIIDKVNQAVKELAQ